MSDESRVKSLVEHLQKMKQELAVEAAGAGSSDDSSKKNKKGQSTFTMDHIKHVSSMKNHAEAKTHAHGIVDASSANDKNKKQLKDMIDRSKNVGHLAQGMTNHMLAHPGEGLKVIKSDIYSSIDELTKSIIEVLEKRAPKGVDPKKHESCVQDVKDKGHDVGSAHAICTSSMKKEEQKVNLNNPYNEQPEGQKQAKKKSDKLDLADPEHPFGETKKAEKANDQSPVVGIPAEKVKEVKIKKLQQQIDSGTYKPDAKKIANKIIKG